MLFYNFPLVLYCEYLFKTTNIKLIINTLDCLSLHLITLLMDLTKCELCLWLFCSLLSCY